MKKKVNVKTLKIISIVMLSIVACVAIIIGILTMSGIQLNF